MNHLQVFVSIVGNGGNMTSGGLRGSPRGL